MPVSQQMKTFLLTPDVWEAINPKLVEVGISADEARDALIKQQQTPLLTTICEAIFPTKLIEILEDLRLETLPCIFVEDLNSEVLFQPLSLIIDRNGRSYVGLKVSQNGHEGTLFLYSEDNQLQLIENQFSIDDPKVVTSLIQGNKQQGISLLTKAHSPITSAFDKKVYDSEDYELFCGLGDVIQNIFGFRPKI